MGKRQPGELALRDYRPVRYSHLACEPGEGPLLTADPWSYLRAHLSQRIQSTKGTNRKRFERALYYVRLAEDFYSSAVGQERTGGVLGYYGMLSLVKAFLSSSGVELETKQEHHGLSMPANSDHSVVVLGAADPGHVHIFHEFARLLGTPVQQRTTVDFIEIAGRIPELHDIAWKLGHLATTKPTFLPIDIEIRVNAPRTYIFTELSFKKRHEAGHPVHKLMRGDRASYFLQPETRDGRIVYRSARRKKLNGDNWPVLYRHIQKEYERLHLASILTPAGYRYYCDLQPGPLHHLCYSFMALFFIGSIVRYRPTAVQETFVGSLRPLATEALALIPRQFLYQLTGRIVKKECVVPYASV